MDLPTALGEMAKMLSVAAAAASDLVKIHSNAYPSQSTESKLAEVHAIADRLTEIAEELRRESNG